MTIRCSQARLPKKMANEESTLIAIDPSIQNVGFAILTMEGKIISYGLIHYRDSEAHYTVKVIGVCQSLRRVIQTINSSTLSAIIELPERWVSTKAMHAQDSEAAQKLYYATGSLVATLQQCKCSVGCVGAKNWKGQTPKQIMVQRALAWLEVKGFQRPTTLTDHEAEALLLGKYAYDKRELISRPTTVRFSPPIKQISDSSETAPMEQPVEGLSEVSAMYGCRVRFCDR